MKTVGTQVMVFISSMNIKHSNCTLYIAHRPIDVSYFPKGFFPSGNFPTMQFLKSVLVVALVLLASSSRSCYLSYATGKNIFFLTTSN